MSEPTVTQQIWTAISSVQAQITAATAALMQRVSWILSTDLLTNNYAIRGGTGENDEALPVNVIADVINLDAAEATNVSRLIAPFLSSSELSASATLSGFNGQLVWYAGTSVGTLTLPDDAEADYWLALRCAPGAANANVTLPSDHTLDGSAVAQALIVGGERITLAVVYRGDGIWWSL